VVAVAVVATAVTVVIVAATKNIFQDSSKNALPVIDRRSIFFAPYLHT